MNNEFKIQKYKGATVYTLESASGGSTSGGSVASVGMPIGGVRKRGDNLIAQEADKNTVPTTAPRNFVAKNAKMGGAGAHRDKKKEQKQGVEKHKKPYMEDHADAANGWGASSYDTYAGGRHGRGVAENERDHPDHEIQMASSELLSIAKNAESLLDMVRRYSEQEGLDAWQQSKITKAADYLNSVLQSINGEQQGVAEALTYPQKHSSWSVRSPKKNEFNTRYKLDQEPEARAHAERIGGKLVKVDQRGHAIRTGSKGDKGVAEGSQKWYPDAPVNDYAGHEYHKLSDTELERKRADQKERHEKLGDTNAGKNADIARGIQVHRVRQDVAEGKDPTTDSAQDARGSHRGEVKKNKDGSYVATNQAGSRGIFKSEQAAKAHANSGQQGVAEGYGEDDGIHLGAKVYHKEHQSGEPFKVAKIIDDQRVGVIDDYGNKKVMFINQLVPAQGVAEGLKDKLAGAALAGSMAMGGAPAHAGFGADLAGSIASGLGSGMTSAAMAPSIYKEKNAADKAFAEQIPDEADKAKYLKGLKYIMNSRSMANSGSYGMIQNTEDEIQFKKFKQRFATKYNIQMPTKEGVDEEKQRLDPKCWTGKHKEGTKMKGGVRVNNCVPNESVEEDSYFTMLERSVSQAQHNLMVGVAHNPQFAQQVKVKQKVGQEFAQADVGHDISKLPIRVPKKK